MCDEAWCWALVAVGIFAGLFMLCIMCFCFAKCYVRNPNKGSQNKKRLDGRVVLITGANTGIGKATATDIVARGARVIILCRSLERAQAAADDIKEETGKTVEIEILDLSSLQSVRDCAKNLTLKLDKVDILINNAAVMHCPEHMKTKEGFDMQFGTNHLGHFLLTNLLLPLMKKSASEGYRPRIVTVSSLGHTWHPMNWDDLNFETTPFNTIWAYSQSKLANILHMKELAKRLEGTGITTYSLHPGAVSTDLVRHWKEKWYSCCLTPFFAVFSTPLNGAQTTLYCALDGKAGRESGLYYAKCKVTSPSKDALVEDDQKRLWQISEKMVNGWCAENNV